MQCPSNTSQAMVPEQNVAVRGGRGVHGMHGAVSFGLAVANGGDILPDIHPPPRSRPGSSSRWSTARRRIPAESRRRGGPRLGSGVSNGTPAMTSRDGNAPAADAGQVGRCRATGGSDGGNRPHPRGFQIRSMEGRTAGEAVSWSVGLAPVGALSIRSFASHRGQSITPNHIQCLDGAFGQGRLDPRDPFCGGFGQRAHAASVPPAFINASIRSAMRCAGSRSWPIVQPAA